ncbi:MAG: 4-hydroxy-tetrahydrodipicolinate reductase, partial [Deltaproteobacteria bacterium]|nr:4-hydroxy-tetrahydrodipicolinate reductase [Deltaproteobacteria bacterium]
MTKVIVAGAAGRMGRRISYMVHQQEGLTLTAGFERPDGPELGK